jgi:UDP-N-acetylglucosamine 4-epimerase
LYEKLLTELKGESRTWLVTGAAGFIGSNLVEALLHCGQTVVGLDNLSTGHLSNLEEVREIVGREAWRRFRFLEADILDLSACREAVAKTDHVLHQAALGSVPRSIADPIASHDANVTGFINMLVAARDAGVRSFTYAASSATYGDEQTLPKVEDRIGEPLSPYAATKLINEIYARVFARSYGFSAIGLRYFNVFGPRQDPNGAYAAVIPKWTLAMIDDDEVTINGDGETSRDFCFVENAVEANLLASLAKEAARNQVYNVAYGARTSLNQLFEKLRSALEAYQIHYRREPRHVEERRGDVRHSLADITKAQRLLGYAPRHSIDSGVALAMPWYVGRFRAAAAERRPEAAVRPRPSRPQLGASDRTSDEERGKRPRTTSPT